MILFFLLFLISFGNCSFLLECKLSIPIAESTKRFNCEIAQKLCLSVTGFLLFFFFNFHGCLLIQATKKNVFVMRCVCLYLKNTFLSTFQKKKIINKNKLRNCAKNKTKTKSNHKHIFVFIFL